MEKDRKKGVHEKGEATEKDEKSGIKAGRDRRF
jgi:hypothetical protein